MDLNLTGRVYVVTGGSRGLGLATARGLVAEGAKVVLIARDDRAVREACSGMSSGSCLALPSDLADPELAERTVAAAIGRFGRLDGACLSTGGPPPTTPAGTSDEQWRDAFDALVVAPLRMARAVAAQVLRTGVEFEASLLFVLSTSVFRPLPGLALSNALRAGLANVVRDLAAEWGPSGIRVNGIAPGRIATDRVAQLDARAGDARSVRRARESNIPLRRYGRPDEFGAMATFLMSPAASYITGAVVPVDGGATFTG